MTIIWYGHSCFKINNQGGHITIITDPFDKKIGLIPPRGNADVVTISHNHFDHNNIKAISGDVFAVEGPGEYEIKGIRIMGRATQGVRIIKLGIGDRVADIAKITRDEEVEKEVGQE